MKEMVSIRLQKAEALVLFDLLAGFRDQPHLPVQHEAERVTLWAVLACLEKELAEPFDANYAKLLEEARVAVLG
jgi:hypothetical protein